MQEQEKVKKIPPSVYTAAAERVRPLLREEAKYGALWLCVRAYLLGQAEAEKSRK